MRLLKAVGMISLSVTLTPVQAAALAEWCRRADLKDFRKIARNDGEAYDMADASKHVCTALESAGFGQR